MVKSDWLAYKSDFSILKRINHSSQPSRFHLEEVYMEKPKRSNVFALGDGEMDQTKWRQWRDILICTICAGIIIWALWNFLNQFIDAILLFLLSMAIAFLIT